MNQLPERHVPVPRQLPPVADGRGKRVERVLDGAVERLVRMLDTVIDRIMLPVLVAIVTAMMVVLVLALLGVFEDRGPGCVTQHTDAGQAVCVKR